MHQRAARAVTVEVGAESGLVGAWPFGEASGKYFWMVARLGGVVTRETRTISNAEPNTIGTTGRKP